MSVVCVSPIHSSQTGLVESEAFDKYLLGPGSSSHTTEGVICRSVGSFGEKTS